MEELVRVEDLNVSFSSPSGRVHAVRGVSFSMVAGEVFALVGESGCGKTVTAQSLMGLNVGNHTQVEAKALQVDGIDLLTANERQLRSLCGDRCSMVFQDSLGSLNPTMKLGAQVTESLRRKGVNADQRRRRAVQLFTLLQIPEPLLRTRQYPSELSGGMRQRAMIAMALACDPKLLIADEPTASLDVTVQLELLRLLRSIGKEQGMAVLFISHDMSVVANLAQRMAVLYAGRIVEQGETAAIFRSPAHPYTQGLLASIPKNTKGGSLSMIPGAPPRLSLPLAGCAFFDRCVQRMQICQKQQPPTQNLPDGRAVECWRLHPEFLQREKGGGQ